MHVLCEIGTRGRYDTTLPMTLVAIQNQTVLPDHLLLIDDTPVATRHPDVYKHPVLGNVLRSLAKRMGVTVIFGPGRGPQHNHEFARTSQYAKELIWRVDDDECPEPNVLQRLKDAMHHNPQLGAVAGLVLVPGERETNPHASAALEDIPTAKNVQWYTWPKGHVFQKVDHLHSSYLYRKEAAAYPIGLSPVGHTEETQHTLRIKENGYSLQILPDVVTWHYRFSTGGIRSQTGDYAADTEVFCSYLKSRDVRFTRRFPILMNQGLGDAFALFSVLNAIDDQAKAEGFQTMLFIRESLVEFIKPRVRNGIVTLPDSEFCLWNFTGTFNVYDWWTKREESKHLFTGNLAAAYLAMYTERLAKGVFQ